VLCCCVLFCIIIQCEPEGQNVISDGTIGTMGTTTKKARRKARRKEEGKKKGPRETFV
jgi:hypothetical protein